MPLEVKTETFLGGTLKMRKILLGFVFGLMISACASKSTPLVERLTDQVDISQHENECVSDAECNPGLANPNLFTKSCSMSELPQPGGNQGRVCVNRIIVPTETLMAPVINFRVTDMVLGSNDYDRIEKPVDFTHPSIYGLPSPTIKVISQDLGTGVFIVMVNDQIKEAGYGSCIIADVTYQEIWLEANQIYDSKITLTVCLVDKQWYFHYNL